MWIWVLIFYEVGMLIAVILLKKFLTEHYPDQPNWLRTLVAYMYAVLWFPIIMHGLYKALLPPIEKVQ